jgi:hypothetical protein
MGRAHQRIKSKKKSQKTKSIQIAVKMMMRRIPSARGYPH